MLYSNLVNFKAFNSVLVATLLAISATHLSAQPQSTDKENMSAVTVQEPSSQEFKQDRKTIRLVAQGGDLSSFAATVKTLSDKWLTKDKLSYYCILSEVCGDLTSYDFGTKMLSKRDELKEKYALEALNNGSSMPLGLKAYFVQHLTYVPGHGDNRISERDWVRIRDERASLWINVWQQLQHRIIPNFSVVPVPPKLPPIKFIYPIEILNGYTDPNNITDAGERAKYIASIEKYKKDRQMVSNQEEVHRVESAFAPRAEQYLVAAYSSRPADSEELRRKLAGASVDPKITNSILTEIKSNQIGPP